MAVPRVEVELARQAHLQVHARAVGGELGLGLHVARETPRSPLATRAAHGPLVRGPKPHRDRRHAAPRLLAPHDGVQELVADAARGGEGHAIERGQARDHFVQLAAEHPVEEDGLRPAQRRERRGTRGGGKGRLVHQTELWTGWWLSG